MSSRRKAVLMNSGPKTSLQTSTKRPSYADHVEFKRNENLNCNQFSLTSESSRVLRILFYYREVKAKIITNITKALKSKAVKCQMQSRCHGTQKIPLLTFSTKIMLTIGHLIRLLGERSARLIPSWVYRRLNNHFEWRIKGLSLVTSTTSWVNSSESWSKG